MKIFRSLVISFLFFGFIAVNVQAAESDNILKAVKFLNSQGGGIVFLSKNQTSGPFSFVQDIDSYYDSNPQMVDQRRLRLIWDFFQNVSEYSKVLINTPLSSGIFSDIFTYLGSANFAGLDMMLVYASRDKWDGSGRIAAYVEPGHYLVKIEDRFYILGR